MASRVPGFLEKVFTQASEENAPVVPEFEGDRMSVLGAASLDGGAFVLKDRSIRRPPGLKHSKLVFAFNVPVETMYLRFKFAELIYVQQRIPAVGDEAAIEIPSQNEDETPRSSWLRSSGSPRTPFLAFNIIHLSSWNSSAPTFSECAARTASDLVG